MTPDPVAPAPDRTAYLVLGMHRSGTSAVTQLLALAGADLPANLMPSDQHNAKGYFEPWKIAMFNNRRLRVAGGAWDDVFGFPYRELPPEAESAWVDDGAALFDAEFPAARAPLMKDPRATILAPLWRAILKAKGVGARCVIPVRHPMSVAGSLGRRDGFSVEKSVLLWSAYMLAAEAYTRDLPRAFVGYDALLADWRAETARIEAAHGAPLPALTARAAKGIDRFLTPELRHNAAGDGLSRAGAAGAVAQDVYDWFDAAAAGRAPDGALLARAARRLEEMRLAMQPLVSPAARDLDEARTELLELRQQHDHLRAEHEAVLAERAEAEARLDALLARL